MTATTRVQAAHRRLEEHVTALKRAERAIKESIRFARQIQAELLGVEVITQHGPEEGEVDNRSTSQQEADRRVRQQVDEFVEQELGRHGA